MLSKTRITILALTGAIAMTGVAEAKPTPKLTIKGPNGDFQGTIKAQKKRCMNNRTVRVFMNTAEGPEEIGSDSSELNSEKTRGLWSIGNSGYKNGKFFARADAKGSCAQLKSKTITVVTPDAEEPDSGQSTTARTVRGGVGTLLPPGATSPSTALQVDGADGGYSRKKCLDLLQQWEGLVDEVIELYQHGMRLSGVAKSMEADEVMDDMSNNCLIVY